MTRSKELALLADVAERLAGFSRALVERENLGPQSVLLGHAKHFDCLARAFTFQAAKERRKERKKRERLRRDAYWLKQGLMPPP